MMAGTSEQTNRGEKQGQPASSSGRRESAFGPLTNQLDDWIRIETDGMITAFSGKVELGQGVRTALGQIVAEELDVPFERVHMVMGDTSLTPDEGYTAGSMTIMSSGDALRQAAAEARKVMLEMASDRLDATTAELIIHDGLISVQGRPERSVAYAELMGGKPFSCEVSYTAPLKAPRDYRVVGSAVPRVDIPNKFTGQQSFIQDMQLPGMLHARVVRPPSSAAQLVSLDESSIKDIPGIVKIVQKGNFVGGVAEREEQAVLVAQQLKVEWSEKPFLPPMAELYSYLRSQPTQDTVLCDDGEVEQVIAQSAKQIRAEYHQPYHAHASIGPSCALADVKQEQVTVWSSAAGPYPLRSALAQLIGMPEDKLRVIYMEGSGSYGQNGSDDAAADAVVLSQAVGRPVRLQWTRQDEFVWEPKAPSMVMEVSAGLDDQNNVTSWDYHVWSPSHVARARFAAQLVAAQLINRQPFPAGRFSFGAERNAPTNYTFPKQRLTVHYLANTPLRSSSFRSLGGAENTFANESFVDELAALAGADPLEFRLRYLDDPRALDVLHAAAEKAGWERRSSPKKSQATTLEGRGLAFARYENEEALVACIAEVQVNPESGLVRAKRIVVAHDCGLIINPDGLKNQIEGNVIQSLSRALKEEVKFDEFRIQSVDWDTYPILKFSEVPEVEIVLINRPDEPALGAGEPSTVTTSAAVANAIFDATGIRLRQIPFTPERVKAALSAGQG
ncbi:MAG TPA: molybdopterin cofactor-binding domain-containing protein [Anaerolineales bacterium]